MRWLIGILSLAMAAAASPAFAQADDVVCFSKGSDNYKKREFEEGAIRACGRLIQRRSGKGLASAYAARGYWYTKQGKLDLAMADLDKAVETDPSNVEFYDYRADIWMDKGETEKALSNYQQSIRVDPTYAAAYYGQGRAYEKLGRVREARESYQATLAAPEKDRIGAWAQGEARQRLKELDKK